MKGVQQATVIDNISTFLDLRKHLKINGPIIETVFFRMLENEHEETKFIKSWQKKVDHVKHVDEISNEFAGIKGKKFYFF